MKGSDQDYYIHRIQSSTGSIWIQSSTIPEAGSHWTGWYWISQFAEVDHHLLAYHAPVWSYLLNMYLVYKNVPRSRKLWWGFWFDDWWILKILMHVLYYGEKILVYIPNEPVLMIASHHLEGRIFIKFCDFHHVTTLFFCVHCAPLQAWSFVTKGL